MVLVCRYLCTDMCVVLLLVDDRYVITTCGQSSTANTTNTDPSTGFIYIH